MDKSPSYNRGKSVYNYDKIDYTPNSFNESIVRDTQYTLVDPSKPDFAYHSNFILTDTGAMNNADVQTIMGKSIDELNVEYNNEPLVVPQHRDLLIDETNHDLYGNVYNDPKHYADYINNTLDHTLDNQLYQELLSKEIENPNFQVSGTIPSDKFWLEDPMVLFRNKNYLLFFPKSSMSKIEILNALTRAFIYLTILYIIFSNDATYMYIPIIGILIIIFMYYIQKTDKMDEKRETFCRNNKCNEIDICQVPTAGNPFMNVTMADLMDRPDRPGACIATDKTIKQQIDYNYNQNLFKDVDDLYNRGYSERQFYTMPSTTIPNEQTTFAKWLYKLPETCKENQANCLKYEDIRFNRFNPNIDRMERIKEDLL